MPAAKSRLSDFLPYLMSVSANAVSDVVAQQYHARFGLKIPEWRVMAVLGDAGALTQRRLVSSTRMDKVAVNRACKALEERGLAQRSPCAAARVPAVGRGPNTDLAGAGATGCAIRARATARAEGLAGQCPASGWRDANSSAMARLLPPRL